VTRPILLSALIGLAALGGCGKGDVPPQQAAQKGEPEPETIDIPQTVTAIAPGTTPMAERVAVIGLLNKRNGIAQDLTLKPGQSVRIGDVVIRLRACETSAPWEIQQLTGAFVQLDVRNPKGQFQRVFSGWLYKETPSLNVVEHPIYDVWPKSCAMTHPGGRESPPAAAASSNLSSASNSAAEPTDTGAETTPEPSAQTPAETPAEPVSNAAESNAT
jgi:hypothetical protein